MRNALFFLGGGLLVYWYMCNEKKYGCNCKGDIVEKLGDRLETEVKEVSRDFKDAVLEKDGAEPIKPSSITSTGRFAPIREQELASELNIAYGETPNPVVTRRNISSLYRRYNTQKSATISPNRIRVICVD